MSLSLQETAHCGYSMCVLFMSICAYQIDRRLVPTLHFHWSGRYPYLRQRKAKCWGCGAVVRPISWTNGGLTALCTLGEDQAPAAGLRAERARVGVRGEGGGLTQLAAVVYSRPLLSGYSSIRMPLWPGSTFTLETKRLDPVFGLYMHDCTHAFLHTAVMSVWIHIIIVMLHNYTYCISILSSYAQVWWFYISLILWKIPRSFGEISFYIIWNTHILAHTV